MSEYKLKIRPEKAAVVEEMKEKLSSKGVALVSFNKLTVKDATQLRRIFRAHGVEYKVIIIPLPASLQTNLVITDLMIF